MNIDSYEATLAAVRVFYDKHRFEESGGEDLVYRVALMTEELEEISACVTKGEDKSRLVEESADLMILLIGTAISADLELKMAFWIKIETLTRREARYINGRIRVSEFDV